MTQVTHRGTWLPSVHSRSSAQAACFVRGVIAAGVGLGSFAVLVVVLWISSPYPDSGPGGALRVAAGLWLLAHGADLVRSDTLSGVPAPVGLTPMLLVMLPVWLTHRAARDAMEPEEGHVGLVPSVRAAFLGVTGGYLVVGAAALLYAYGGPLPAGLLSSAVYLPVVAAVGAAGGVWTANGRRRGPLPGWVPGGAQEAVVRPRFRVAVRAGGAGVVALMAGGAVVALASLVWHAQAAEGVFLQLAGAWSGRFAVALLVLALVPNAAVWGAAYGLGPGFVLGAGATATPLGVAGTPALPHFPLIEALPSGEGATPVHWATLTVPVVAAGAVAWCTVRTAAPPFAVREEAWSLRETAFVAALAGVGCGAAMAVLAALASGPLGVGALSEFGPVWWRTGGAALVWTVTLGVPAALFLRAWRLRDRTPGDRTPRDRTPGDRTPGDRTLRDRTPRDRTPRDRTLRDRSPGDRTPRDWRGWWRRAAAEEPLGQQRPEPVPDGTKGGWWRRSRGGVDPVEGAKPWWRPGGRGAIADDATGPYDGESDFLPIGDPGATTGAAWHDSGPREVRWEALREAAGLAPGFPAASDARDSLDLETEGPGDAAGGRPGGDEGGFSASAPPSPPLPPGSASDEAR